MRPSPDTAWRARSKRPTRSCRCRTSGKPPCGAPLTCPAATSRSSTRRELVSRTDAVTRILFESFSAAEVRLFYAFGCAAIAAFAYGVYVQIRKYRRGAPLELDGSLRQRLGGGVGGGVCDSAPGAPQPGGGGG